MASLVLLGLLTFAPRVRAQSDLTTNQGGGTETQETSSRRFMAFRVGADLGFSSINRQPFYQLNATGLMRISHLRADFDAPLRFQTDNLQFREADWEQPRDAVRLFRCVRLDLGDADDAPDTYDPACAPYDWVHGTHSRVYLSARILPVRNVDLGHHTLVSGFNNSLDPNHPQLGGLVNGVLRDWGSVHALVDDVVAPRVVAARASLRPLVVALDQNWDTTPDDFAVGASVVSDLAAPLHLASAFGRPVTDANGNRLYSTTALTAVTLDAHYLYLWSGGDGDSRTRTGLFGFLDYNRFLEISDADAFHGGVHFRYEQRERFRRFNNRELPNDGVVRPTWQIYIGGEYRFMGGRYLPGYFDANYMVQSQQFALTSNTQTLLGPDALTTTKLEYLLSRPEGRIHGFQAYLRMVVPVPTASGEPPEPLPLTFFLEGSQAAASTSVGFVAGPFQMDQLIVAAQFQRRNFDGVSRLFALDGSLIRVVGRILFSNPRDRSSGDSFWRSLALNLRYDRRFFLDGNGQFQVTNDFLATIGSSLGLE